MSRLPLRSSLLAALLVTAGLPTLAQDDAVAPLVGLLEVPELMPADPCRVFAPIALPLYASPEAPTPIGHLRGSGRATATPCEFPAVRVAVGAVSQQVATEEHAYEAQSLLVTEVRPGWYRILTGARPAVAWLRAGRDHVYRPLATLYEDGLTYLGDTWDRRLYTRPNGAVTRVLAEVPRGQRFQPVVRVDEVTVVDGIHWARVTFIENPCGETGSHLRGSGWVRVHAAGHRHRPVLWFYSRGC